jgi:hypothetical protein
MLFLITEQADRQGGIQRIHQIFDLRTLCALRDTVRENQGSGSAYINYFVCFK